MVPVRYVSPARFIKSAVRRDVEFLELLAKELMLDELLCGEADPKDFLVECFDSVLRKQALERLERRKEHVTNHDFSDFK